MKKIGIVGFGFSGLMTAVHLILNSNDTSEIILIEKSSEIGRGIAYNSYSNNHLLNVTTRKMSAFSDRPNHFLDWVMKKKCFKNDDINILANSYLPRNLYGEYLQDIWKDTKKIAKKKQINIIHISETLIQLYVDQNSIDLIFENTMKVTVDKCVLATGNHIPKNLNIKNMLFYNSQNYFQNPWKIESVKNLKKDSSVLIIGNGLTMVDTVLGLLENGFKGTIFSISPNGFNILPHRHDGQEYTKLIEELGNDYSLLNLVKLVNKHIKKVRKYGISAEPIINSLRPITQKIWLSLSENEKKIFLTRLRHLWGVARHRIPLHIHDKIQQLRIDNKLNIYAGKILDCKEQNDEINIDFYDKKDKKTKTVKVSRVINCTGPDTNIENFESSFLKHSLKTGIITQDNFKLGIKSNPETFQILNQKGEYYTNLFTLGSNLKGELWETTAVNELRNQSEQLVKYNLI